MARCCSGAAEGDLQQTQDTLACFGVTGVLVAVAVGGTGVAVGGTGVGVLVATLVWLCKRRSVTELGAKA